MNVSDISGIFEIHITVDITDDMYKLWKFVKNNNGMKLILAVSQTGVYKEQYMISKYSSGNFAEMLDKIKIIENDMAASSISIVRTKIESMAHNNGVPQTEEEFLEFMNQNTDLVGNPYFEFHAKIDLCDNTMDDYETMLNNKLVVDSNKLVDTVYASSINLCGSKIPLLTVRIYDHGCNFSTNQKNIIFDALKEKGYKIIGGIQQEFSVYDTNDGIDKEWLI